MQLARGADCKLQFILYTEATFKLHAHTVGWKIVMWQAAVDEATAKLVLIGISEASGMSTNRDTKNLLIHICQLKINCNHETADGNILLIIQSLIYHEELLNKGSRPIE